MIVKNAIPDHLAAPPPALPSPLTKEDVEGIVDRALSHHLATPPPPQLMKQEVEEIVDRALSHHLTRSISQKIQDAVERKSLERDKANLEERVVRLQQALKEEKDKAVDERRRGELAAAEERKRGERTRYNWEAYSSGVSGGRHLEVASSRSVSG